TGRYFDGEVESDPHPQAHDVAARAELRRLSNRLTGLGWRRNSARGALLPERMGAKRGFPATVAAVLVLAAATATGLSLATSGAAGGPAARPAATQRPNVVVVLTDDLAWNLVQYMPHVRQLQRRGLTFSRYFVTDS